MTYTYAGNVEEVRHKAAEDEAGADGEERGPFACNHGPSIGLPQDWMQS